MLSPGHVAFILLAITQTALSKEENLIAECRYAASAGSLIVHIVLIYLLVRCYRNFGLGLKEKGADADAGAGPIPSKSRSGTPSGHRLRHAELRVLLVTPSQALSIKLYPRQTTTTGVQSSLVQ
ncbi:uncharacterized protein [Procambarus clarkii]|uniref:uncharacterized protein n=1 Tax=Procambarus clarkii TaxID=6728 RepID=UPI003744AF25